MTMLQLGNQTLRRIQTYLVGDRYIVRKGGSGGLRTDYCFDLDNFWDGYGRGYVKVGPSLSVVVGTRTFAAPADLRGSAGTDEDVHPLERASAAHSSASRAAEEIRQRSGLSVDQLAAIFPTRRENYHRWLSRRNQPSEENFSRLLALRHFVRELGDRVDDPRAWLLSPLADSDAGQTPYEILTEGRLSALWPILRRIPSRRAHEPTVDSEGGRGVRILGGAQGDPSSTPEDERDDAADWLE